MSDILKLFEGQDLSEEAKGKITALFSEAVDSAAEEKVAALKESVVAELTEDLQKDYDAKLTEKLADLEEKTSQYIQEEVLPEVDKYLTATVNEWQKENQIAIENGSKVALAESFLQGLVGLAEGFNVTMPQSDLMAEMQSKIDTLSQKLQEATDKNVTLVNENINAQRQIVIAAQTATLSESQKDKLKESLDKLTFNDSTQFATAVKSLVESTFPAEVVVTPNPVIVETKDDKPKSYASMIIEKALK